MDSEQRIVCVVLSGKHALNFKDGDTGMELVKELCDLFHRIPVIFAQCQFKKNFSLFPGGIAGFPAFNVTLESADFFLYFLGIGLVVPE